MKFSEINALKSIDNREIDKLVKGLIEIQTEIKY